MNATYLFAGLPVEINTIYAYVHEYCAAYRTAQAPLFAISTEEADLDYERAQAARADDKQNGWTSWGGEEKILEYLESLSVYRKIAERMPFYNVFLFHGSALAVDGTAYLFTAKSGTGKSTHARLWREMLGERALMVNDDKPLIRLKKDGTVTIYGTPYDGKHRLSNPVAVPLKAICLLNRGAENSIERISPQEAFPSLWIQAYRPRDPEACARTLELVKRLSQGVELFRLFCNQEPEAARVSFEAMGRE